MSIHPGAVWRRVDLQCHTPRDLGWVGSPGLVGGHPDAEKARHDWARLFVAAALDRSLSVVAVTDHHDIAFEAKIVRCIGAAITVGVYPACRNRVAVIHGGRDI